VNGKWPESRPFHSPEPLIINHFWLLPGPDSGLGLASFQVSALGIGGAVFSGKPTVSL